MKNLMTLQNPGIGCLIKTMLDKRAISHGPDLVNIRLKC